MTVDEIVAAVQDHEFDDITSARIVSLINAAYYDVVTREPWPFLETIVTPTVVAGVITAPTDIGKVLWLRDTVNKIRLRWIRWDDAIDLTNLDVTGNPLYFYSRGDSYIVYPATTVPALQMGYIKVPATLAAGGTEASILMPPRYHWDLLVVGAASRAYYMTDDSQLGFYYRQQFEENYNKMRTDIWTKQYDRYDYVRDVYGEDD